MNKTRTSYILHTTSSQGFTLIEILISSAILVMLAAGFLGMQYILSKNQVTAWNNYLSIESSNTAMSVLIKELRNATNSDNGSYPLESLLDQEIIFYSDTDYDGKVERVRYTINGTQLLKGVIEPVGDPAVYDTAQERETVVSDILRNNTDPIFYYYNSDWPSDTTNNPLALSERIANTKFIKIFIKTSPRADTTDFDYIIESDVKIRMLGAQ